MSNNEPAFPVHKYVNADGETFTSEPTGMTLRDYFAAKAMVARAGDYYGRWQDLAHEAYAIADAMLCERAEEAK